MSGFSWDHNAYYHRLLLRQIPRPCRRALDVGCGAGAFAGKLAEQVERVDALDRSPVMIETARQTAPDQVTCILGDVLHDRLPTEHYDAIFSVSALHHLPLREALPYLAAGLRPGGVLAALALPRTDLPRELPVELTATLGQWLFGAAFAAARSTGGGSWYAKQATHRLMPLVCDPAFTIRQVRHQAATILPGVRVRRLVFWRYLLLWHKPAESENH